MINNGRDNSSERNPFALKDNAQRFIFQRGYDENGKVDKKPSATDVKRIVNESVGDPVVVRSLSGARHEIIVPVTVDNANSVRHMCAALEARLNYVVSSGFPRSIHYPSFSMPVHEEIQRVFISRPELLVDCGRRGEFEAVERTKNSVKIFFKRARDGNGKVLRGKVRANEVASVIDRDFQGAFQVNGGAGATIQVRVPLKTHWVEIAHMKALLSKECQLDYVRHRQDPTVLPSLQGGPFVRKNPNRVTYSDPGSKSVVRAEKPRAAVA